MRAVQVSDFGPVENLVVEEVPEPSPGPGEVVVEVAAAGVNFPDILVVEGSYQHLPERPFSPGKEAAGRVLAVGPEVSRVAVGDRVLALVEYGAFTEQLLVPEDLVVGIPDAMSFEQAAGFGLVYSTAYFALVRRGNLAPGETVVVTGAGGGVGSAGIALAKALGATVVAVSRDPGRAGFARDLGADHFVVADPATLRDDVMAVTGGHGADVVLEVVGGDVFTQLLRATAWEGRMVVIGFASGHQNPIKPGHLLVKNISVMGLQASDYRDRTPDLMRSTMEEMLMLFEKGAIGIPIDATYDLDRTSEALLAVKQGRVRGKAVIVTKANR